MQRLRRRWAHRDGQERGAVLVMVVVMMGLFLAIAALAVDLGRYSVLKSRLQNTSDMAATAGATAYDYTSLYVDGIRKLDVSVAQGRAADYFWSNDTTGLTIEPGYPRIRVLGADGTCEGGCTDSATGMSFGSPTVIVEVCADAGVGVFARALGGDAFRPCVISAASVTNRFEGGRT